MFLDPALLKEALLVGIDCIYDANGDGTIDSDDINIIAKMQIPGVTAKIGTLEAVEQFNEIAKNATKTGYYKGESLAWGEGGRSELLRDKLMVQGYSPENAETIVKRNYVKQRYWRMENNLPV